MREIFRILDAQAARSDRSADGSEAAATGTEGPDTAHRFLAGLLRDPRRAAFATVREASGRFTGELDRHLWRDLQGSFGTEIRDEVLRDRVDDQLLDAIVTHHGGTHGGEAVVEGELVEGPDGSDTARWTIDVLEPTPRLWIFGAGEEVVALVRHARALEWDVVVVAPQVFDEQRRRFAAFDSVRVVEIPPREAAVQVALRLLPERRPEVAVLATTDELADGEYRRALRPLDLPYIGGFGGIGGSGGVGPGGTDEDVARALVAEIQGRLRS